MASAAVTGSATTSPAIDTGEGEAGVGPTALKAACALYVDQVTGEVVAAMRQAGIPAILLKGPSIARWLYPAGGRMYRDTDLLVPPSRFADAGSVLRSLEFTDLLDGFDPFERRPQAVERSFVRSAGARPGGKVDLHRNLPQLPTPDVLLWETFAAASETTLVGGVEVRVLNRTAVALHVVLHAVQHAFGAHTDEDLRRAIDVLPLDGWREVARLAERLGVAEVLGLGLRRHASGVEVADLLALPQLDPAGSAYHATGPWAPRGGPSLARLRSAPTLRDKAGIVRWALVPSPAKVRYLARTAPAARRSLALDYLRYWRGLAASIPAAVRFVRGGTNRR